MFVFRSLIGLVVACGAPTGATAFAPNASPGYKYPFQNPTLRIEERVTNILSLMTLEEKINCLGTDPDVPRLGTKGSGHIEGLHAVALGGPGHLGGKSAYTPTTQFPQFVGLGERWDPDVLQKVAHCRSRRSKIYLSNGGIPFKRRHSMDQGARRGAAESSCVHPMADLARDARWGRTEESYGEDPVLTGVMAAAFVKGLQGSDSK